MNAERRAELARLLNEATPSPWTIDECVGVVGAPTLRADGLSTARTMFFEADCREDEALIVAAVNALPDLLADSAELERLRAVVEQVRNLASDMAYDCDQDYVDLFEVRGYADDLAAIIDGRADS